MSSAYSRPASPAFIADHDPRLVQHAILRLMLSGVEAGFRFLFLFSFVMQYSTYDSGRVAFAPSFACSPAARRRPAHHYSSHIQLFTHLLDQIFAVLDLISSYSIPHQCPMCNTMTHRVGPIPTYMYAVPYLFASTSLAPLHSYGPCMAVCAS